MANTKKNQAIAQAFNDQIREAGGTSRVKLNTVYQEVGEKFFLSGETVRQIVNGYGNYSV